MPVIKKLEATDISLDNVIRLFVDDENKLHVVREYHYIDSSGNVLHSFGKQSHDETIAMNLVPDSIKTSLIEINNFINNKILEKEGLQ